VLQDRDELNEVLVGLDFPNRQPADDLTAIQQRWLSGQMTNFDYLIQLNKLAGRSMNDLMQYPIFPFVLAQYNKSWLDLGSLDVYRLVLRSFRFKNLIKVYSVTILNIENEHMRYGFQVIFSTICVEYCVMCCAV